MRESRYQGSSEDKDVSAGGDNTDARRKMRILYVTLQPTIQGQAAYAHVHEIVGGLRGFGHPVDLVEPTIRRTASIVQRLASVARTTARFIWRLLWRRPDVVYVRQHPASLVCTLIARGARVPVVLEVNGPPRSLSLSWPMLQRLDNLAERAAEMELRLASGVIAVTPELAAWSKRARGLNKSDVWVIPNGANIQLMRPVSNPALTEFGLESGRYVLFAGALAVWQGIDDMLAAAESSFWPEEVQLVVCGDGRELPKVLEAARRNKRVRYLGVVPYVKMPDLISGSLAGLAPKRDPEGLFGAWAPLKVFEYLACGRPAIVSSLPNLPEIVADAGIVVPPRNPEALAKAVAWIAQHPKEREQMNVRARALAEERYSWRERAAETERVLSRIVRRANLDAAGHC